jgi:uncharacterized membrane protein
VNHQKVGQNGWHVPLPRVSRLVTTKDVVRQGKVNTRIGVAVTAAVGTMWAFYIFAIIEFGWMGWQQTGLGTVIKDPYPFAFLLFLGNIIQLLLMPLIMVGQNVQSAQADARAKADFEVNQKAEKEIEKLLQGLSEIDARTHEIAERLDERTRDIASRLESLEGQLKIH